MVIEPKRIKLNPETPSAKKVKTIPLPPIENHYDIEMKDDGLFSATDKILDNNLEDHTKDNTQSI